MRQAVFLFVIVISIISSQILMSVATASGAYEIANLKTHLNDVSREAESLKQRNDALYSPQFLAMKAEELGMVANNSPSFLRLSDGAVLGYPVAAEADDKIIGGETVSNQMLERTLNYYPELRQSYDETVLEQKEFKNTQEEKPNGPQVVASLPGVQTH